MTNRSNMSKVIGFIILTISSWLILSCHLSTDKKTFKNSAQDSISREQNMKWFKDAKFGMFIHWGPYSRLGGEWKGTRQKEKQAEWIMNYLKIPVNEYREAASQFNPTKFDAEGWVKLAKATGMKYLVIAAKHHDGFAMYHSKVTDYNIHDWTPFKRDPLKELADACAKEGIKFCVYYSHREDWDHPGGYGNNWDYDNEWGRDLFQPEKFTQYLKEKAKPQLRELLSNYGPVGLVWFDRGIYTKEQGMEFVQTVRELQPACLVNSRVGHSLKLETIGDYQSANDNLMPPGGLEEFWETPQTLNETWGFNKFDTLWKSPEAVTQRLVEIVSRGGNYLLNIGPTGEGEIPKATVEIFKKVGPWVQRNAESIYGTSANQIPPFSWGYSTIKGGNLYLFVRDWPKDGVLNVPGFKNKAKSAYFLLDKSVKLPIKQAENITHITLPKTPPDHPITVVVLEIEGTLQVDPPVKVQDRDGKIELNYLTAINHGKTKTRYTYKLGFHISRWTGPNDIINWIVKVNNPGIFKVNISYAADKAAEDQPYLISDGTVSLQSQVLSAGDAEYHELPVGYFKFPKPGKYTITMRPITSGTSNLMYLKSVTLSPVKSVKPGGWGIN